MQVVGLIAIGFALGVLVTVLFGHRIAVMVASDVKAVAFDAGRVVTDSSNRIKATVSSMELRMHAKLDAMHAKVDVLRVDALNAASGQLQKTAEVMAKKL